MKTWEIEISMDWDRDLQVVTIDGQEIGSYKKGRHSVGLRLATEELARRGVDVKKLVYQAWNQAGSYLFKTV